MSDAELVARARAGDRHAWSIIQDIVRRQAVMWVRRTNLVDADVDDITQQVLLRVFHNLDKFDLERPFPLSSWVGTITHNTAVDVARSWRRLPAGVDAADLLGPAAPDDVRPEFRLAAEGVYAAVAKLGETERDVLNMCYFGDESQEEIARRLKIPSATVRARVRRAVAHLRELVRSEA